MNNKKYKLRNKPTHLYNPKEEGRGSYDVHYINAYRKILRIETQQELIKERRDAA